jgi:hypothetical protein
MSPNSDGQRRADREVAQMRPQRSLVEWFARIDHTPCPSQYANRGAYRQSFFMLCTIVYSFH